MTREDEIRARCDNATPGPWQPSNGASNVDYAYPDHVRWTRVGDDGRRYTSFVASCSGHGCHNNADAHFIAHAREDIPYLLQRIAELEQK